MARGADGDDVLVLSEPYIDFLEYAWGNLDPRTAGTITTKHNNRAGSRNQILTVKCVLLLLPSSVNPRERPDNKALCIGTLWHTKKRTERSYYALLS